MKKTEMKAAVRKKPQIQKLRRTILFLWIVALPVVFGWFSPIVTLISGIQRTVNLAMVIYAIWLVSSLFLGRAYCAYTCPFGAGQEAFGSMMGTPHLSSRSKRKRRIARYIVFILWIVAVFVMPIAGGGFKQFNPYLSGDLQTGGSLVTFHGHLSIGMIFYVGLQLLVFIILTLTLGNRAGCQYGCPMSVIGDLGTRIKNKLKYPSLHLEVDPQACTHCHKCTQSCQMSIGVEECIAKGKLEDPDCIMCGACVESCPKGAIHYVWMWKGQKKRA